MAKSRIKQLCISRMAAQNSIHYTDLLDTNDLISLEDNDAENRWTYTQPNVYDTMRHEKNIIQHMCFQLYYIYRDY